MSDFNSVKAQIQSLIDSANATTGNTDTNLTDGVNALIGGYGQGGGSLEGLENGYDVMFYDENNEGLAFYSIKEGNEMGSPICEYNRWVTSDGMYKFFPCTPNEDMTLYGRIEGIEEVLYNHFGVSKTDYPYLMIVYNSSYYLSVTFSKSYTENGNTWQGNNVKYTTSKRIGSLSEINAEIMLQKVVETFSRADLQESTSQSTSVCSNFTVLSNFNITSISTEYRIEDFEDKLYTKYGVSKNDYPYLFIIHNVNSSYLGVCFFKTITTNSSNRLEYKNFMSGNITLPQALNNIDLVTLVDSAISNIPSVALGSTTAGAWTLASNHYFASNFDVDAPSLSGEYRLDE